MTARPSIATCIGAAAHAFGIDEQELRHARRHDIAQVRFVAMLMAREAGHSLTQIGFEFGFVQRNAAYGVRVARARLKSDPSFNTAYVYACLVASAVEVGVAFCTAIAPSVDQLVRQISGLALAVAAPGTAP